MKTHPGKYLLLCLLALMFLNGCKYFSREKPANKETDEVMGEYTANLTDAPNVPESPGYTSPKKVIVKLEVIEKTMRMADGVEYNFWTFGGKVPGKFIRVREGDLVEFHLINHPSSKMPHNIDLHAVTGPGGGAEASMTAPGHKSQFSFRVINPGLYVYHCATAPVGMHIANGMYGLILVEPKGGLPKVDKEFYVMQGDFYTKGKFGEAGLQDFDMEKAMREQPEYVLFNGSVGANAGANAMEVKVGETVRLYVGNGGPNLVSSFHVIGEIFDKVYIEGGDLVNENIQTTLIPAGGSAIVEFKCEVAGMLNIVDHSIFRTFNKGALAQISVVGEEDDRMREIYSHKQSDEVYQLEGGAIQTLASSETPKPAGALDMAGRMKAGALAYKQNCASCHMPNGQGMPNAFPPLAKSDFLMKRSDKGIGIILHGLQGQITVNGKNFNGAMPAMQLSNEDVANILTYVRNSWGNSSDMVTPEEVAKLR